MRSLRNFLTRRVLRLIQARAREREREREREGEPLERNLLRRSRLSAVAVGKTAVSIADPDLAPRRAARLVSTSSLPLPSFFSPAAAAPQTRFTRFSSRVRVHSSYTNACSIRNASLVRRRGILRSTPGLWRYCRAFGCRCAIFPRRIRIKIPCRNWIAIFALRSSRPQVAIRY